MNYGLSYPIKKAEDWIFGDQNIPDEIVFPDGHGWENFLPPAEFQSFGQIETQNCTAYGWTAAIEMFLRKKYGDPTEWSERALGIEAGTSYISGNDPNTVGETIRKKGLLPDHLLPFDTSLNLAQSYYTPRPLPQNLQDEEKKFLDKYDFRHDWVTYGTPAGTDAMKEALKRSPLCVAVYAWTMDDKGLYQKLGGDNHWISLYDFVDGQYWMVFDSYENNYKKFEWNYPFDYVKRIWIGKKTLPEMSLWERIWEFIKNYFKSIFA